MSPSRYTPMGEGMIPLAEIAAYCDLAGVPDAQARLDLMRGVRAMDRVFMAERNEARKAEVDTKS